MNFTNCCANVRSSLCKEMLSVQGVLSWLFRARNGYLRPCLFFFSSSSRLLRCIILCFALHVFRRDKFPQVVNFLLVISFPNRGQARVCRTPHGLKRQRKTRDGNDENQHMLHGTNKRTHRRTRHTTTKHASFRPDFLCPPQKQNSHTQQRKNSERMFCRTLPKKKTPCRVAVLDTQSTKWHFLGDPWSSLHAPIPPLHSPLPPPPLLLRPSADARARHVSRQKTR